MTDRGPSALTSSCRRWVVAAAMGAAGLVLGAGAAQADDSAEQPLLGGVSSTVQTAVAEGLDDALGLEPVEDILEGAAEPVTGTTELAEGSTEGPSSALAEVTEPLIAPVALVGDTVDVVNEPASEVLADVGEVVQPALVAVVEPVVADVVEPVVVPVVDAVEPVVVPVVGAVEPVVVPVVDAVEPVVVPVVDAVEPVGAPVADVLEPAVGLVRPVADAVTAPLAPVTAPVLDTVGVVVDVVEPVTAPLEPVTTPVASVLNPVLGVTDEVALIDDVVEVVPLPRPPASEGAPAPGEEISNPVADEPASSPGSGEGDLPARSPDVWQDDVAVPGAAGMPEVGVADTVADPATEPEVRAPLTSIAAAPEPTRQQDAPERTAALGPFATAPFVATTASADDGASSADVPSGETADASTAVDTPVGSRSLAPAPAPAAGSSSVGSGGGARAALDGWAYNSFAIGCHGSGLDLDRADWSAPRDPYRDIPTSPA